MTSIKLGTVPSQRAKLGQLSGNCMIWDTQLRQYMSIPLARVDTGLSCTGESSMQQKLKKYDVYQYDPWGGHHSVMSASSKTEVYERCKKQGYPRSKVEVFERK